MKFEFKHRPDREYAWEAYISIADPDWKNMYKWCWDTFGHQGFSNQGEGRWDNYSGWIKLRGEEELTLFTLRWA
jgi:hypothetical protein